jgi:hypothetical protein
VAPKKRTSRAGRRSRRSSKSAAKRHADSMNIVDRIIHRIVAGPIGPQAPPGDWNVYIWRHKKRAQRVHGTSSRAEARDVAFGIMRTLGEPAGSPTVIVTSRAKGDDGKPEYDWSLGPLGWVESWTWHGKGRGWDWEHGKNRYKHGPL